MTIIGGAGDTIPDTDCDAGDCTPASATAWVSDTTESGWGYSLENVNVGITAFNYDIGSSFTAKPFGVGSSNSQTIMSNTSRPASPEQAYICYRIVPGTSQKAGNYETKLVYIATAVF